MRIGIVGGGIAGLACAHRLQQLGHELIVLDAGAVPGGVIRTETVEGYPIETGPHTCIADASLRALAAELGLALVERPKDERARFLVRRGKLVSPLRAMRPRGFARALWGFVRKGPPAREDETVYAYAARRFGEEAARRLFDPLCSGIFAGDANRLSWVSALSRFGKRRGEPVSFEGGMGALPAALARAIGPVLRTRTVVRAVGAFPDGGYRIGLERGDPIDVDAAVIATPSFAAAEVLRPLDPALGRALAGIRYSALTNVVLGYAREAFPYGAPKGFGFLVPSEEGFPILGCLYSPAPPGKVALRVYVRGLPEDPIGVARASVEPLLRAALPPELARSERLPRAIPQYEVGHAARLREIDARLASHPGLYLAGNAYRGVSVGDVIDDARRIAEEIARNGAARVREEAAAA